MNNNIEEVYEHSIIPSIINKNGWILDLGCVNFKFYNHMLQYTNNVVCVDANPNIEDVPEGCEFINSAVVPNNDIKEIQFFMYEDKNGNSLYLNPSDYCPVREVIKVPCVTINDIMIKYGIKQFELIKFDIEGGEYDILQSLDWKISKQYSIEFHDFRNFNKDPQFYEKFNNSLLPYCDIVKHEKTHHPGFPYGRGYNYWDSLFILKKEFWIN